MSANLHSPIRPSSKGWLYNTAAQALWGSGSVVISLISKSLASTLLVSIRHGLGALLLGINLLRTRKNIAFKTMPWKHAIALGIVAGALPDILLTISVRHVGPIVAILLARLEIPLGVLFAHLLLKEKVTAKTYGASLLGLLGAIGISYKPGETISLHNGFYLGIAAGLGASLAWGIGAVYGKYILNQKANSQVLTFTRLATGSLVALLVSAVLVRNPLGMLQDLRVRDWLFILYLGLFNSGLGYLLFYRSMELIDAHVAQILMGVSMIVTIGLGLLIGVSVTLFQWLGILTILGSLYLIRPPKAVVEPDS